MRVVGPTLALRPVQAGDDEALYALGQDPAVTRWFSWGPYTSIEQPRAYLADQLGRQERGEMLDCAVLHHEHGLVGITGLGEVSARDRRAIVGTWIARAFWGTGVNAESKRLLFHLAFAGCGMARVGAYANPANGRSVRALEKVGFAREGLLRGWHRHGDAQLDVLMFGLLRADWEALEPFPAEVEGEIPPAFRLA